MLLSENRAAAMVPVVKLDAFSAPIALLAVAPVKKVIAPAVEAPNIPALPAPTNLV